MSVLSDLEKLHAAEDFFAYLQLAADPARLGVARLHIMKRMGKYLAEKSFAGMSEEDVFAHARDTLARAYADFTTSSPIDERVFKVLQEHDPNRAAPAQAAQKPFFPLESLTVGRG